MFSRSTTHQRTTLNSCPSSASAKRSPGCSRRLAPACVSGGHLDRLNLTRRTLIGTTSILIPILSKTSPANSSFVPPTVKADEVLVNAQFPDKFPFGPSSFSRLDEESDLLFYEFPRFGTHIDNAAIDALTRYYNEVFPSGNSGVAALDLCSSWVSHYPEGFSAERVSGLGMNQLELSQNDVLTDFKIQDLNLDPTLPYPDNTFDLVTNNVSVDYLIRPLEVFQEVRRVLKPGGRAIVTFSNRWFPIKAINLWTSTSDADHVYIVGAYFHFAGGFERIEGRDISPNPSGSDPMYVVTATKIA